MDVCSRKLLTFAVFAGVLAVVLGTPQKITKCCTEVSVSNVTASITGYRLQKKNPPCVRAVVFETTEGEVCSHWRESWVIDKIRELKAKKNTTAMTGHKKTSPLHLLV